MSPLDHPTPLRNSDLDAALAEAHEAYAAARPKSAAIHARARAQVMPGGNTRSVLFYTPFPPPWCAARAAGCGTPMAANISTCSANTPPGCSAIPRQRILDAVKNALDRGINLASVGEAEQDLARLIVGRFPSIELVRFTNSGTEANLMALAAARGFTGRVKTMVMRGGYHGGVLTFASENSAVNVPIPLAFTDYNDAAAARRDILAEGDQLAAVLVEPMMGSGGCIPATPRIPSRRCATRRGRPARCSFSMR